MPECPSCGSAVTDGSHFCASCGSKVQVSTGHRRPSAESIAIGEQRLLEALRDATLGDYEIQGEIGRGGMAVVYLAHDISLNRKVAIKVMTPALMMMDDDVQRRFKREAQTAASLSHPHIIPVYAVKEVGNLVFFVMKYIVGRSLESVIKEVGALPFPVVQTILNQAGGALAHAHKRGVVHRDVKPGNIMMDEDGWVVVADFGIAKVAEAEALTMTGGVVGTPAYMSPEQCSGGQLTGAADQYSLGIVAYEMITGRTPFKGGTMVNLIYDHCHTEPPPVLEGRHDCPPELAQVVERMIAKDPDDRFPSIEEAVTATGFATDSSQEAARTHMQTLVQNSETDKLLKKFQSAGSPIPPRRTPGPPSIPTPSTPLPQNDASALTGTRREIPVWTWAVPLVGVTAAVMWFAIIPRLSEPSAAPNEGAVIAAPTIAGVTVQPLSATLQVGETVALDAVPRANDGSEVTGVPMTWQSTATAIVEVTSSGVVTARSAGSAQVTVQVGSASASIVVTVTPPPQPRQPTTQPAAVASVRVTPGTVELSVGDRARVAATLADGSGAIIGGRTTDWSTSDPTVVSVDANGIISATGAGVAQVQAQSEGIIGAAIVTVVTPAVATVRLSPATLSMTRGETAMLTAAVRDQQQRPVTDRAVSWQSDNLAVARVSPTGVVTAVSGGSARITAMADGQGASIDVTVTAALAENRDTTPARDHRAEIEQAIETYRLAINSHDINRIRAAFPDMPQDQQDSWTGFFSNTQNLVATFHSTSVSIDGTSATATISAQYRFRINQDQAPDLTIVIRLRQTANGWRIVAVE